MTKFEKEYLKAHDWSFITSTLDGIQIFSRTEDNSLDELHKIEINSKTGEVSSYYIFDHEVMDVEEFESFNSFRHAEDL